MANFSSTIPYGIPAVQYTEADSDPGEYSSPAPEIEAEVVPSNALARRSYETTIFVEHADLPRRIDNRLVMLTDPGSPTARSYRLLRHRLLTSGNPRAIAVTSAQPKEGKTTCAVNLALAIAEDSLGSVLLLDANPRRPGAAKLFKIEALERPQSIDRRAGFSVVEIDEIRLHVAVAAQTVDSEERLDRAAFGELLHDLRRAYDYVIIDAASVLESADTDVAAEFADGVVLAARAKHTRRAALGRALDELRPATIFGVVLIDT